MNDAAQQAKFRETEENSTRQRAGLLGLQYFDSRGVSTSAPLVPNILSVKEMYDGRLVPLQQVGDQNGNLVFAITNNTPQSLLRSLRERFVHFTVQFVIISNPGFREFMQRYDPPKTVVYDDVKIAKEGDSETIAAVSRTLDTVRSDDILNYLIEQADQLNASDIHIECQRDNVRIRLRVDGALHPVATITHDKYRVLQASIATKANISTVNTDAQTGHMQSEIKKADGTSRTLNMRIETVPTVYGQDAVIRLFNFDDSMLSLERLNLAKEQKEELDKIVSHPHGMVLVVGPTGSGKSTTLYSILNALNTTDRKILTLEDPVEFSVPGISQIPVNTSQGDSFADKLRAVMRLDPDVVMVGEIRDADTAKTAIQASITGHLVLSTFHAATAAAAMSRIIDMIGVNPIFSTAIRLIIGQRLVRRLDDSTKIEYDPDEATASWVRDVLKDLPDGIEKPNLDSFKLWKPGTSNDVPFGYKGRVVVMEQMVVSEDIQKFLRGDVSDVNTDAIEKTAQKQGMATLLQDGVLKALRGETTIEEVNRVI
ncbi:MAG TPA: GspE/PulE family protein [Candidatus Saccharimonadales bacterium]|nr:GspE/PulE family protein [Candidatus Saccharimonadales bacterium]